VPVGTLVMSAEHNSRCLYYFALNPFWKSRNKASEKEECEKNKERGLMGKIAYFTGFFVDM